MSINIPSHAEQGIDPRCHEPVRDSDHRLNCRCGKCPVCGEWIKGIWWNEHEDEHWAKGEERKPSLAEFLAAAQPVKEEEQLALF